MAIEFARVRYIQRSKAGNVCRSAAYNARGDVRCERTGERFYFAHRDPGLHNEIILPYGADEWFLDPVVLWNEAQAVERRKNSQEARELLLALPSDPGLDLDDWRTMCREFVQEHFVGKGVAVQVDIHGPHEFDEASVDPAFGKGDVNLNFHAHVLITTRRIEGKEFSRHKARDLDPEIRTMKGKQRIVTEGDRWGVIWRDYQNLYFERQGLDLRVDETGFRSQRHEGPVRLRTVPKESKARLEETRAANEAAARDPAWVLEKVTERRPTFTELDIERLIRKYVGSPAERTAIRKDVLARPEVVALYEQQTGSFAGRYTTREVRSEERDVLDTAEIVARSRRPIDNRRSLMAAEERSLDEEQQAAFAKATGTDGLVVIEGLAGTGKSHGLDAIREAHERAGWRAVGLSLTNVVANNLHRSGFQHASTAHREVWFQERGGSHAVPKWDRRTVVIVDETPMLDTGILRRLMRQAAEKGAKVILAGDDRQQGSVQRGGLFTQIKERHGSVVISRVRRQEQGWQRTASEDFSGGRMVDGIRAYAEHGHVHWSHDIDESRARLLSDWDQDSRERPDINRFVYAGTNAEVGKLNRAIHDIRVRRGEVKDELEADTVKGRFRFGTGDSIQFHATDRAKGILNGATGTITGIQGDMVSVGIDGGRKVAFDAAQFRDFSLGYASTIYRGQGKTHTEVYALYDSAFAWNARTAYVGMTRHRERVELYVSTDLAEDEVALARQMTRKVRDEASLAWAARSEVREIGKGRDGKDGRDKGESQPRPSKTAFNDEQTEKLRRLDLPAYARDVHGYTVGDHPSGKEGEHLLVRAREDGRTDRLEVRVAGDGHWTWREVGGPRRAGDIFDLARREGAADLKAAREAVSAYNEAIMREPNRYRRAAEAQVRPDIAPDDPERSLKKAGAEEDRRRNLAGADLEDQREAAGEAEEQRQNSAREETARVQRLGREATRARNTQQRQLKLVESIDSPARNAWLEAKKEEVVTARMGPPPPEPQPDRPQPTPAPNVEAPKVEAPKPEARPVAGSTVGIPTPAQLRYNESLARHYDPRSPISSLAEASLNEAVAFQREQHQLNQSIAAEADPNRRQALMLRRDIEHADHMNLAYGQIAMLAKANGADDKQHKVRADDYRNQAVEARQAWNKRGEERPDLYAPLNPERARTLEPTVPEITPTPENPSPDRSTEPTRDAKSSAPERNLVQERIAMKRLNLPEFAAEKHGYQVAWSDPDHTRASLTRGKEELRATKGKDGAWSYESRTTGSDRGDIVDFEIQRGARTVANARAEIRPELDRVEREQGRLDMQPGRDMEGPELERSLDGPSHDGPNTPQPTRKPQPHR